MSEIYCEFKHLIEVTQGMRNSGFHACLLYVFSEMCVLVCNLADQWVWSCFCFFFSELIMNVNHVLENPCSFLEPVSFLLISFCPTF